jgi:hypothetical protein
MERAGLSNNNNYFNKQSNMYNNYSQQDQISNISNSGGGGQQFNIPYEERVPHLKGEVNK